MLARSVRLGGAALLALVGCAHSDSSSSQASAAPQASAARRDVVIQFSDMSVEPAKARVQRGGSVAWTSVASSYYGVVSFPASIAGRFTCTELRPDFVVSGDRLISSSPLAGGGESLVLPCPLQPGTYSYRIDLTEAGSGEAIVGRELDAVRSLPASLEVE